jgi:aspartyl-tRNA(Asn)/glutamyl-tRNA(Gln) amidotransferase subunit A
MNSLSVIGRSASELGRMIRTKELSPVEIVRDVLDRIHQLDPKINSFIRVLHDAALADAEIAQNEILRGQWRGPLHGVPFAVKDIFDVKGTPTTAGSKVWENFIPAQDASAVLALRQAGAILVGKLNMHELAFGITSNNPHFGPTFNPWDLSASCGGSSSGSAAALAAGFVPLTLGTDTGGSIRIPSSLTGVVGLKPTYGLISRKGVLPLAWSMDHVGPMAIHVEDLAAALVLLHGWDTKCNRNAGFVEALDCSHWQKHLKGTVIGVPTTFFYDDLREDIKTAVLTSVNTMESLGASIEEIHIPGVIEADRAAYTVLFSEAATSLEVHARTRPHDVSEEVLANVRTGMTIPATRYIHAQRVRTRLLQELREVFSRIDVLAVPGTMADAHPIEAKQIQLSSEKSVDVRTAMTRYTRYFNLAGNPVLNMPCGLSVRGLPVGMQLVGKHFDEAKLLQVGFAYQQAFPLTPLLPELK